MSDLAHFGSNVCLNVWPYFGGAVAKKWFGHHCAMQGVVNHLGPMDSWWSSQVIEKIHRQTIDTVHIDARKHWQI